MFRQIMKALSVKQPWASLIASGKKSLEIRTWRTDHRGPLLIVASRTGKFVWEFIDPQPVLPTRIQGRLWVFDVPDELITFESQNLCATLPE